LKLSCGKSEMWWLVISVATVGSGLLVKRWLNEEQEKRELLEQIELLLKTRRGGRVALFLEGLLERSGEYTAEQLAAILESGIQQLEPDLLTEQYFFPEFFTARGHITDDALAILLEFLNHESNQLLVSDKTQTIDELPRESISSLLDSLADNNTETRINAILQLGNIGDERAVPELCHLLATDASPEVRLSAAEALGRIGVKARLEGVL
jgi:HEAT repeats